MMTRLLVIVALWGGVLACLDETDAEVQSLTLHVDPSGNDAWSGHLRQSNANKTDGPFATIGRAQDGIRRLKAKGPLTQPVRVSIAAGTYELTAPIVFGPQDSGTQVCPITYEAAPGAKPVFTGGRAIKGFHAGGDGLWTAEIPEVKQGKWYFEQLWVNGRRATRARSPNKFYYYVRRTAPRGIDPLTGQSGDLRRRAFIADPNGVRPLMGLAKGQLNDAVIHVYYAWETARLRPAAVDKDTGRVVTTGPGAWPFCWLGRERYQVENIREALDEPGEWYLDRGGTLTYKPLPGEDAATAVTIAPVIDAFVQFSGDAKAGNTVEHITLQGLSFKHARYALSSAGHSDPQAAVRIPAVIRVDGARNVAVRDCKVAHTGTYGLWFRRGCQGCRVERCWFEDLGAGGVKIGEDHIQQAEADRTHHNVCDNNIIHGGGRIFPGAVGVWVGQSSDNQVTHNDISDLFYTGVSVGWSWGYAETACKRNQIEFNHIHHIGQGVLSDMGGVYTLGVSDGTTVSNNVIHDVYSYNRYGNCGLGLYNDEGSTHIRLENNLVYNTLDMTYHQHYGKENVVRNNILVCGTNYQISVYRSEPHLSCTFENNIVYFKTGRLFWAESLDKRKLSFNRNVYWDATGRPMQFMGMTLAQWQAIGQDKDSVIADPLFENPDQLDFRLKPGSPALKLGFKPFDYTQAGVYGDPAWVAQAKGFRYAPVTPAPDPPPAPPLVVDEDFESYPVGAVPGDVQVYVEHKGDSIAVTDETAAAGKKSVKLTDVPGLKYSFNPHMVLQPNYVAGHARCRFDVRLEEGVEVWHEFRDWSANPYTIGPHLQMAGGKLKLDGHELMGVPVGRWFHVEVSVGLGDQANGLWELTVVVPGQESRRFTDLKVVTPGWKKLNWVGFVSNANRKTCFYLDNIQLDNR